MPLKRAICCQSTVLACWVLFGIYLAGVMFGIFLHRIPPIGCFGKCESIGTIELYDSVIKNETFGPNEWKYYEVTAGPADRTIGLEVTVQDPCCVAINRFLLPQECLSLHQTTTTVASPSNFAVGVYCDSEKTTEQVIVFTVRSMAYSFDGYFLLLIFFLLVATVVSAIWCCPLSIITFFTLRPPAAFKPLPPKPEYSSEMELID